MGEGRYIEGRREIGVSKLKLVSSDVFLMTRNISYNMKCTLARHSYKKKVQTKWKFFLKNNEKCSAEITIPFPKN